MFKLAHISDLHLRPMPNPSVLQLVGKRITGYLNWKLNRKHALDPGYLDRLLHDLKSNQVDHTVITGDLVNLALPEEFDNASRFLDAFGNPEQVTVQFGNHDAYVPGALKKAINKWQAYASGDDEYIHSQSDFPILRIRGDIAIIACNSAEATAPFFATGYFRKNQASRLADMLERTKDKCRVVCIHHPPLHNATPWYKRLIGTELFQKTIKQHGAELILHGHTHLATCNTMQGPLGEVPVICVPAAGNSHGNIKPAGRYNIFSIEKKSDTWKISMEAKHGSKDSSTVETAETRVFSQPLQNC